MQTMRWFITLASIIAASACHVPAQPTAAAPAIRLAETAPAPAAVQLSGVVLGHDGEPLPAAHVTIHRSNFVDPVIDVDLDGDGRFEVELPSPSAYMISVAGVDHAYAYRQFAADEAPIEVEVRLGTYPRTEAGDALEFLARWVGEDGEPGKTFPVTATRPGPSADHRLHVEVPSGARALQYQITGMHAGHSVNGPGGQRFAYDGGGDYWAEVALAKPDQPELVLDLDLDALPPANQPTSFEFRGAEIFPSYAANQLLQPFWGRIRDGAAEGFPKIVADARAAIESLDDPVLAKAAAIEWLLMFAQFVRQGALEVESLTWVFERVPPDDRAWAFYGSRLPMAFLEFDSPTIQAQLAALAEHQNDAGLLAELVYIELIAADARGDQDAVRELFGRLASDYVGSRPTRIAAARFDPARPLQPGKPMPNWSFSGLDGQTQLRAADLRGRAYLLDIWATWCGPCVADMQILHETYAAINGGSDPVVEFVFVSNDVGPEAVETFRAQWPMPWRHAWIGNEEFEALAKRWQFSSIPTMVLVDADGTILATSPALHGPTLRAAIDALVSASRPASDSDPVNQ
jgi:thiol-disulfide isomerase/thioredoxin